jgi:cysteine-rich repeat protein
MSADLSTTVALSNAGYSATSSTYRAIANGTTNGSAIRDYWVARPDSTGHLSNNKEFAVASCSGMTDAWVTIVATRLQTECGNGLLETGEGCDDKGTSPGDGCSATCSVETGWGCAEPNYYDGLGSYCSANPTPPANPRPPALIESVAQSGTAVLTRPAALVLSESCATTQQVVAPVSRPALARPTTKTAARTGTAASS